MLALTNGNTVLYTMDHKNIFPTYMLAYLVLYKSSFEVDLIEVGTNIKYEFYLFLDESLIQEWYDKNADIYVRILDPLVMLSYLRW